MAPTPYLELTWILSVDQRDKLRWTMRAHFKSVSDVIAPSRSPLTLRQWKQDFTASTSPSVVAATEQATVESH